MYNQIPNYNIQYMASGGPLATLAGSTAKYLAKFLTDPKKLKSLEGLAKSLTKRNAELSKKITLFTLGNLDVAGVKEMQRLAQEHYHKSGSYLARKAKIEMAQRYRKLVAELLDKLAKEKATQTELAAAQAAQATELAAAQATELASKANGFWGGLWQRIKSHPYIALGTGAALTNGYVREGLGSGLGWWFRGPNDPAPAAVPQTTVKLSDGTVVPITMQGDGTFVVSSLKGTDPTEAAINQVIAQANTPALGNASDSVGSYTTNGDFNDLFENDAWDL